MSKISTLLDTAKFTRQLEAEFVAELSPQERLASGKPDDWAAKDLVAHVTSWRERGTADLEAARSGSIDPEPQEFDEANRAIFEENRDLPWDTVLGRVKTSWTAFLETLAELPDELMVLSAADQPTRPLWRRISVEAGNHPCMHYAEYARRHGRTASATRWMEGMARLLRLVDPSPEWHGIVDYNLACHYALSGQTDNALDALRLSFERNPGLRDWSKQDSDLGPLHSDPRFTSLVGS
jgi:hypothetical protein